MFAKILLILKIKGGNEMRIEKANKVKKVNKIKKIKIVNGVKFIKSISVILGIVTCISLVIGGRSFSHSDINYKTIYVSNGDSLWSIAKEEKNSNLYYENKDIREVIANIKKVNKLGNNDLSIGQKLLLPNL